MGRKATLWMFETINKQHLTRENLDLAKKGNIKRETESLLIVAQNNAKRTNHIKARINKTQQNSKCRLCGDRGETINHIISECSKLAQKEYKTRHDLVGIAQEIQIWPYERMVHAQPSSCPGQWRTSTPMGF